MVIREPGPNLTDELRGSGNYTGFPVRIGSIVAPIRVVAL